MHKDSHVMLQFKDGLPKGEYVLMYRAAFTKEENAFHPILAKNTAQMLFSGTLQ